MNLGYEGSGLFIHPEDLNDKSYISLYHIITKSVDFKNKTILEIGSGRGGGCYYFSKHLQAQKIIGIDLSSYNTRLASKLVAYNNVAFLNQDAEKTDLPSQSFDIVVNVESSHCYPRIDLFFQNAFSLLKFNGYFIYADIFHTNEVSAIKNKLQNAGFMIQKESNITDGVLNAVEKESASRFPFTFKYPYLVPEIIKTVQFTTKSKNYMLMKTGQLKYLSFICFKALPKPEAPPVIITVDPLKNP